MSTTSTERELIEAFKECQPLPAWPISGLQVTTVIPEEGKGAKAQSRLNGHNSQKSETAAEQNGSKIASQVAPPGAV
jgi:hypothetical protein